METNRRDWRTEWHIGYEANKAFHALQSLNPDLDGDIGGMWKCPDCNMWVGNGYLCPCNKMNKDDLRYHKDKLDGKFIF